MVSTSGGTSEYTYFLRDHVGSSVVAVDDEANVIEGASHGHHDPWGQPWSADGSKNELKEDSRGFTGHENIASLGLIHMNGRVYDPMIGQFTGPDRLIQNAGQMVGLNRYAYIGNSPVNGIDSSGWAREKFGTMILEHGDPIPRNKFIYAVMAVENNDPRAFRVAAGGDATPGRLILGYAGAADEAGRATHAFGGHIALMSEGMGWNTEADVLSNFPTKPDFSKVKDKRAARQYYGDTWLLASFGRGRFVGGGFIINNENKVILNKFNSFKSYGQIDGHSHTLNPIAPHQTHYLDTVTVNYLSMMDDQYWRNFLRAVSRETNLLIELEPTFSSTHFRASRTQGAFIEGLPNGHPSLYRALNERLPGIVELTNAELELTRPQEEPGCCGIL
jgi:RHS repeat-associated protein